MVKIQCKCGKVVESQLANIRSGHSKCCGEGKCRTPRNDVRNIDTTYYHVFGNYRNGALRRGLTFNLSFEKFKDILHQNCFYCGKPASQKLSLKFNDTGESRSLEITYNGIDRVKNDIGYELDNVVSCCKQCNIGKHHYTKEEFINWVKRIHKHLNL